MIIELIAAEMYRFLMIVEELACEMLNKVVRKMFAVCTRARGAGCSQTESRDLSKNNAGAPRRAPGVALAARCVVLSVAWPSRAAPAPRPVALNLECIVAHGAARGAARALRDQKN